MSLGRPSGSYVVRKTPRNARSGTLNAISRRDDRPARCILSRESAERNLCFTIGNEITRTTAARAARKCMSRSYIGVRSGTPVRSVRSERTRFTLRKAFSSDLFSCKSTLRAVLARSKSDFTKGRSIGLEYYTKHPGMLDFNFYGDSREHYLFRY